MKTADEILENKLSPIVFTTNINKNIKQAMIEFAKMHVEQFSKTNMDFEEYVEEIK